MDGRVRLAGSVGLPISHAARNADFITSYNPTGYAPGDANYQIHLRVVDAAPIPILIGKTLVRSAPGSSWLDFDGNLPFRSQVQAFLHAGSNTGASDTCPLSSKYNSQSFQTAKPACDIDSFAGGVTQMECRFDVTSG